MILHKAIGVCRRENFTEAERFGPDARYDELLSQ